ncbi:hypothetical protein [Bdellovibrio reynosensis]|uniref:Kinesin n=1 Tax=Bdellovibrio reynosensis TaxID=2835041 RepID=A0ABY4C976_9BACT|nr:hypothetical protein [Bdellovibrio reynosensis]UOF01482.1 hypothetical protein MNR06_00755 [Bdellovibrio reynosensis]
MTIEKFLSFWSQHNTVIIESLVGLVIFLSLVLAYRSFFGKKGDASHSSEAGSNLDTAQLEKTLQKILDNQSSGTAVKSRPADDLGMDVDLGLDTPTESASSLSGEAGVEVEQMKISLADSQKRIEALQAQLKDAQGRAQEAMLAAQSTTAAAAAAGSADAGQSAELAAKVKDLEARLSEYEIISEDIADLSRFREENEELRKQLEGLQKGLGASYVAPVEEAAPAAAPAAVEPAPEPVAAEPAPEAPAAITEAEVAMEPVIESASEPAPATDAGSELIDDELMKEFAAAVEGQKKDALDSAAAKAGEGSEKPKESADESEKLMNEFENFVAKKS